MSRILFFIIFFTSSIAFASDKMKIDLSIGLAYSNQFLYNPEISARYYIHERILLNASFGSWRTIKQENSNNANILNNYSKIGGYYKLTNNKKIKKSKSYFRNNKRIIVKYHKTNTSGFFIGGNLVQNSFFNGETRYGYSIKYFYQFQNSPLNLGIEHLRINKIKRNLKFEINALSIGLSF